MNEPVIFGYAVWYDFKNSSYYHNPNPMNDPYNFFDNNGDGVLVDCISCLVTEERNGIFELELTYPIDGACVEFIEYNAIIKVKARPTTRIIDEDRPYFKVDLATPQLFSVYEIIKNINGTLTVRARHISYILSGVPCMGWEDNGLYVAEALSRLTYGTQYVLCEHPFLFRCRGYEESANMKIAPSSVRNKLLGLEGSLLDTYGGEYVFDNFKVIFYAGSTRGFDNGITVEYGKNLQTLEQDQNCAEVYSGLYPFWYGEITYGEGDVRMVAVQLDTPVINFTGVTMSGYYNILSADLTSAVSENIDIEGQTPENAISIIKAQLAIEAQKYISSKDLKNPKVSLTVSFAQLQQFEEFKDAKFIDSIALCDTIRVRFPKFEIDVKTKIVKMVFNPLLDRVESVDIGTPKQSFVDLKKG